MELSGRGCDGCAPPTDGCCEHSDARRVLWIQQACGLDIIIIPISRRKNLKHQRLRGEAAQATAAKGALGCLIEASDSPSRQPGDGPRQLEVQLLHQTPCHAA